MQGCIVVFARDGASAVPLVAALKEKKFRAAALTVRARLAAAERVAPIYLSLRQLCGHVAYADEAAMDCLRSRQADLPPDRKERAGVLRRVKSGRLQVRLTLTRQTNPSPASAASQSPRQHSPARETTRSSRPRCDLCHFA